MITQLREEFKTILQESKMTQATTMQGYIREAISANTKSLTNEGTSLFVTQAELGRQLSQFKTDLQAMFHPPPPTSHTAPIGDNHPSPFGPYGYLPAYLVHLQKQAQTDLLQQGQLVVVTPERDPKRPRDHSPETPIGKEASVDVEF
jgi:hypothetical protein